MPKPFTLCVYCGSRFGDQDAYADAARAVGRLIGHQGWRLVYGGGRVGLMGAVADAALQAGAEVIGVIPKSLAALEVEHRGLTELHLVDSMHQRKNLMAELSDAFIALPGGIGTMEELFEIWTWRQLDHHAQPIGLLNVAGYYEPLLGFLHQMADSGFVSKATLDVLEVSDEPTTLLERIAAAQAR